MKYIHCDNIDWKEFDGESVLLDLSTGYYFRLNRLGTFVWPLINRDNNVGDIVRMVVENFDVSQRRAKADIDAFIDQLLVEHLIQKV